MTRGLPAPRNARVQRLVLMPQTLPELRVRVRALLAPA
jgi:hypothetical protein